MGFGLMGAGFGQMGAVGGQGAAIFLLAGQSNAVGQDTSIPTNLQTPDTHVKIWNVGAQAWQTYVAGTNSDTLGADPGTFGCEGEFARLWRLAAPTQNVYIIKYAVDATPLATDAGQDWNPSNAELFAATKTEITTALAALVSGGISTPQIRAVLWMQGEHDAEDATNASNYQTNLTNFITQVRAQWVLPSTRFLIGRITTAADLTFSSVVRAAQLAVADGVSNCSIVSTDTYPLIDTIHYDKVGLTSLGSDFWAAYNSTYNRNPTALSVTWQGGFETGFIPSNTGIGAQIATLGKTNPILGTVTFSVLSDPDGMVSITGTQLKLATAIVNGATHSFTLRVTNNLNGHFDQAVSITGSAASAFTPAFLFQSGEVGLWYDPSDFTTMWQDSDKTTPVTGVGQAVGYISDKSGNGFHATQETSGQRPLLQQDGAGKYYLDLDGVDDYLGGDLASGAIFQNTPQMWIAASYKLGNATADTQRLFSASVNAQPTFARFYLGSNVNGSNEGLGIRVRRLDADSGAGVAVGSNSDTSIHTLLGYVDFSTTTGTVYLDGTQIAQSSSVQTAGNTSNTTSDVVAIGSADTAFSGRVYGVVASKAVLSAPNRALLTTYLGAKAGQTI